MTIPENIRINAQFPFPALVAGSGPITITKSLGIWTVGFQITNLTQVPSNTPPALLTTIVFNQQLGAYQQITAAQLLNALAATVGQRVITTTGAQAVLVTDRYLLINAAGTVNITLPTGGSRYGTNPGPLTIKDISGAVSPSNNITLTPAGGDTIDGAASYVLNDNFEAITLNPLQSGGWWIG